MAKKKPELDKLDINEIIKEAQDENETIKKEDKKEKEIDEQKDEKKEKSSILKNKKLIFVFIWIILFILSAYFAFLSYKEKTKIIHVYSIPIIINHKVIYLSKKKREEAARKKLFHSYNFNFQFAYEFNGVNSKRILTVQVTCLFKSKYEVNLNELYAYIKSNITKEFQKLTKNRFLEEIPDYQSKISLIIQNNIINAILKVCPDVKKKELMKTFNFALFRIA